MSALSSSNMASVESSPQLSVRRDQSREIGRLGPQPAPDGSEVEAMNGSTGRYRRCGRCGSRRRGARWSASWRRSALASGERNAASAPSSSSGMRSTVT